MSTLINIVVRAAYWGIVATLAIVAFCVGALGAWTGIYWAWQFTKATIFGGV